MTHLLFACGPPQPPPPPGPSPADLPLSGQLRMGYFDGERIAAALPGYVTFANSTPCALIVYLADTLGTADSARALFRHALPYEGFDDAPECPGGRARVEVRRSEYTRAERVALLERIGVVLRDSLLNLRGGVTAGPEKFIVWGQNRHALARARARLASEPWIPPAKLVFQLYDREEVDRPAAPPRAAYLVILDSLVASARLSPGGTPIDRRSLPSFVGDSDLSVRGLRASTHADSCEAPGSVVSFIPPREFVDGLYQIGVRSGMSDMYFELRCDDVACPVTRRFSGNGDYIVTGCASVEFGVAVAALNARLALRRRAAVPPKGWR